MSQSYLPNGNIGPSLFVKLDTSTVAGYVLVCGSTDTPIGISQEGVRLPPYTGLDDGFAGVQNVNPICVYTPEDNSPCWIRTGGSITFGDFLKPDSSGRGVTGSGTDICAAQALESATAADQLIRVRVIYPTQVV